MLPSCSGWSIRLGETAPAWIEALSTLAAAIGAFFAVRYARRAYEREVDRDDQRAEHELREYATQVVIWAAEPPGQIMTSLWVRNAGQLPIFDLVIRGNPEASDEGTRYQVLLGPNRNELFRFGKREGRWPGRIERRTCSVEFTDAGGERWIRFASGRLDHLGRIAGTSDLEFGSLVK